ncbi:MAG: dihydropteroate synthase [Arenicella sp.]|nr:dihydropteroate synthase [Arenicella sp.]
MSENSIRSLLRLDKSLIMGVVNITPDSFSDGGQFNDSSLAVEHALSLVEQGADILDIGGESTRPGAEEVSVEQELKRVIPAIEALKAQTTVPISIDTYKPQVMRAAVEAGASMINDVNGLRAPGAVEVAAAANMPICIMHMQGQPQTMQARPKYESVVAQVDAFFKQRITTALDAGIKLDDIILDPGIGFGKTLKHNLELLKSVPQLRVSTGCQMLLGVSRKSLIDKLLGRAVDQRLPASLGLAVQSILNGAKIVRVHDVRETYDAIRVVEAVRNS